MQTDCPDLMAALVAAQAQFPEVGKHGLIPASNRRPALRYSTLADVIATVRPILAEKGLAFAQYSEDCTPGYLLLVTKIIHTSGQSFQGITVMPMAAALSPQDYGSLLSYARRYGLVAMLGICSSEDDDDGNRAQNYPGNSGAAATQPAGARQPAPADSSGTLQNCAEEGCPGVLNRGQYTLSMKKYGLPLCIVHQSSHTPLENR